MWGKCVTEFLGSSAFVGTFYIQRYDVFYSPDTNRKKKKYILVPKHPVMKMLHISKNVWKHETEKKSLPSTWIHSNKVVRCPTKENKNNWCVLVLNNEKRVCDMQAKNNNNPNIHQKARPTFRSSKVESIKNVILGLQHVGVWAVKPTPLGGGFGPSRHQRHPVILNEALANWRDLF